MSSKKLDDELIGMLPSSSSNKLPRNRPYGVLVAIEAQKKSIPWMAYTNDYNHAEFGITIMIKLGLINSEDVTRMIQDHPASYNSRSSCDVISITKDKRLAIGLKKGGNWAKIIKKAQED